MPRTLRLAKQKYQQDEAEFSIAREPDIAFKWHFSFTEHFLRCAMCQFSKINTEKIIETHSACFVYPLKERKWCVDRPQPHLALSPWGGLAGAAEPLCHGYETQYSLPDAAGIEGGSKGQKCSPSLLFFPEGGIGLGSEESRGWTACWLAGLLLSLLGGLS